MFGQIVSDLQLATPAADEFFKNCTGESFREDGTFLAVLRAIVAPRMKEGDGLHLAVVDFPKSAYNTDDSGTAMWDRLKARCCTLEDAYMVNVVNVGCGNNAEEIISKFDSARQPEGFELDQLRVQYLKQQASVEARVYLNRAQKSTLIIVANLSVWCWHLLAASVCKTLPWFFEERPGNSDQFTRDVLSSLVLEDKPDKFRQLMEQEARKYDFRSAEIKKKLAGFEKKFEERSLQNLTGEIERLREQINGFYHEAAEANVKLCNKQYALVGLEESIAKGGSNELMEYFLMNRHLELEDCNDRGFSFSVGDYFIDMWDEDAASLAVENTNSAIYRGQGRYDIDIDSMQKFFRACFIDEKIRIKVCAAYKISTRGSCDARSGHNYPAWMNDCFPNPHTEYFACLGGHAAIINRATNAGNYVSAVEQCCASARNLNFSDSTVMGRWSEEFFASVKHCVELPGGEFVTPMEAVKWAGENL